MTPETADIPATDIGAADQAADVLPAAALSPAYLAADAPAAPVAAPVTEDAGRAPARGTVDDRYAPLVRDLAARPWSFDFFQAVRRLENAAPARPPIGTATRLADEAVRFGQRPSLAFAPSTLDACTPGAEGRPPRLSVQFLGLCGPFGPMPLHVTEYLRDRERNHGDPTPARFFDLFNHRMVALFYRAWAVNQQTVSFERGLSRERGRGVDHFSVYVSSLFGHGMTSLRDRDAMPHRAKLYYAGRLAGQTRHAEGLAALLLDYLQIPAVIEEFVGEWLGLPEESHCRLGTSPDTCTLGGTAIVGRSTWQSQHRFRIRLGPMGFEQYKAFLPGAGQVRRLSAMVRNYVGDELAWDLRLVLRAGEVPATRLGKMGALGWTTWLGGRAPDRDAEDLVFEPSAN